MCRRHVAAITCVLMLFGGAYLGGIARAVDTGQPATAYVEDRLHDDDSVICAAVNVHTNRARWFVGMYREAGHQGIATYDDLGDHLRWSRNGVPRLVKRLARGAYGTGRVRARCLIA